MNWDQNLECGGLIVEEDIGQDVMGEVEKMTEAYNAAHGIAEDVAG